MALFLLGGCVCIFCHIKYNQSEKNQKSIQAGEKYMKIVQKLFKKMFHEELDIHHRLLNLILSAALLGGTISLGITMLLGDY